MIEIWWLLEITNMLTHHRIITSHDVTKLEKIKNLKISKKFRIPDARSVELKQTVTAKRLLFAQDTP